METFIKLMAHISVWILPLLIVGIPLWAFCKKVQLYESFISGAREGVGVGLRIIPYLVAILVAIGMFRESGAMELIAGLTAPVLNLIGMPADILPLAIIRPLSGSGALGITTEIANQYGGDSYMARLAAVMTGSSETTLYIIAVYFGSVGVVKIRHALAVGLFADLVAILASLFICKIAFL